MLEYYKRFVLWNCRVLQYIPGYRAYGRFLEKHFLKNFWRTWAINMAVSIAVNLGFTYAWRRYLRYLEEQDKDLSYLERIKS